MIVSVQGDRDNIQSDIDFYLKLTENKFLSYDEERKKYFAEFNKSKDPREQEILEARLMSIINGNNTVDDEVFEEDQEVYNDGYSSELIDQEEEQNAGVSEDFLNDYDEVTTIEEGGSFLSEEEEDNWDNWEDSEEIDELDQDESDVKGNEEVDDDDDDWLDDGNWDSLFDDENLDGDQDIDDGINENSDEDTFNVDDDDIWGNLPNVESSALSKDSAKPDLKVRNSHVNSRKVKDDNYTRKDSDDVRFFTVKGHNSTSSKSEGASEIYNGVDLNAPIKDKLVSLNKGISVDDSWKKNSEVGDIENLWGTDSMESVTSSELADKLLYSVVQEVNAVHDQVRIRNIEDLSSMQKIHGADYKEEIERELLNQKNEEPKQKIEDSSQKSESLEQKSEILFTNENVLIQKKEDTNLEIRNDCNYKSLRDFIKKNPNCLVDDAYQYFSKEEVSKEVRLGRIYLSRNRLFI